MALVPAPRQPADIEADMTVHVAAIREAEEQGRRTDAERLRDELMRIQDEWSAAQSCRKRKPLWTR